MASQIRSRRRARRQTVPGFGGLIDLTYEDVLADLDPGMITWRASLADDGAGVAAP